MGTSTDQARQAVVATRVRAEASADRLEARLRYTLDPRQRLRRDGTKLAAGLAAVAAVGIVYLVRARRRRHAQGAGDQDWIADMPEEWQERLGELVAQAAASGRWAGEPKRSRGHGQHSLGARLALRGVRMAAPIVISAAAERLGRRNPGPRHGGSQQS